MVPSYLCRGIVVEEQRCAGLPEVQTPHEKVVCEPSGAGRRAWRALTLLLVTTVLRAAVLAAHHGTVLWGSTWGHTVQLQLLERQGVSVASAASLSSCHPWVALVSPRPAKNSSMPSIMSPNISCKSSLLKISSHPAVGESGDKSICSYNASFLSSCCL